MRLLNCKIALKNPNNYVCLPLARFLKKSGQVLFWFLQFKSVGVEDLVTTLFMFEKT